MGATVSHIYTAVCNPPSSDHDQTGDFKKELQSSVGNGKGSRKSKCIAKDNTKRIPGTRNKLKADCRDSKEMKSLYNWSIGMNRVLSTKIDHELNMTADNQSDSRSLSTLSPILTSTASISDSDMDRIIHKQSTLEELIMFCDYNELLFDGFLRILNTKKHTISSIVLIIRDYSATNWSDITNISVYVRIKPYIATEIDILLAESNDNENPPDNMKIDDNMITIQYQNDKYSNQYTRQYDDIFDHKYSQRKIYLLTAAPLIQACVDGYNVTIFAYGAADCGESFTMFGSSTEYGILQRCIADLGYQLNQKQISAKIHAFKIFFSGLRICDKKLHDLFGDPDNEKQLFIKSMQDIECTFVEGLVELELLSLEDALVVIHNCIVDQKDSDDVENDIILFVKIEQLINNMDGSGIRIESEVKLVKCKESKSMSTSINEFDMYDLLKKTDLNTKLKNTYEKVPFNDLMSDSFDGNRITTMIGCISSDIKNIKTSIDTLKFGSAVMNIKNKPKANINEWWDIFIQPQLAMIPPFKLMIHPKKTFGEIKYDISQIIPMNTTEIALMWDGNYLNDEQSLIHSNLPKKAVIYLSKTNIKIGMELVNKSSLNIGLTNLTLSSRSIV